MSNSYNEIWIHAVFNTKDGMPLINPQIEKELYHFISEQFQEQDCYLKIINGMPDHVHCLFKLSRIKSIADIIKQVKGSSSNFINKNKLIPETFRWQPGYAVFSVSEPLIENVYHYIKNQKQHHQSQSEYPN